MKKDFICIVCPKGCHIHVDGETITGYTCLRGLNYVKQEMVNPTRTITSTVKVKDNKVLVCPVKTSSPVPKDKMFDVMKRISEVEINLPIKMHQIIIENVENLGIDIIATKEYN